jgi:hypothetical protein
MSKTSAYRWKGEVKILKELYFKWKAIQNKLNIIDRS